MSTVKSSHHSPANARKKLKVDAKTDQLRAGGRVVTTVLVCGDKNAAKLAF